MISPVTAPPARGHSQRGGAVAWALAAAAIGLQIAYPLTAPGAPLDRLTTATVAVGCAASVAHALATRGARFTAVLLAVTAGGGLAVEAVGVATGVPFGTYTYTDRLGPQLLGVPLVIPLAWTMMGYPALIAGRRITAHAVLGPLTAGAALAAWDLFLDPQMVAAGHWTWAPGAGPQLLGIPVSNFVGWFVVATAMMAVLWPWVRAGPNDRLPDDRLPLVLYLWTYASSVLAHAAFFDLPGSAIVGGLGMGVIVVALLAALRRQV